MVHQHIGMLEEQSNFVNEQAITIRRQSEMIEQLMEENRVTVRSGMFLVARRATYVVDGRFFGHFVWEVEETVRTHVNSRVAHLWLPYTVINV